jgi:hypothetical protein
VRLLGNFKAVSHPTKGRRGITRISGLFRAMARISLEKEKKKLNLDF